MNRRYVKHVGVSSFCSEGTLSFVNWKGDQKEHRRLVGFRLVVFLEGAFVFSREPEGVAKSEAKVSKFYGRCGRHNC